MEKLCVRPENRPETQKIWGERYRHKLLLRPLNPLSNLIDIFSRFMTSDKKEFIRIITFQKNFNEIIWIDYVCDCLHSI